MVNGKTVVIVGGSSGIGLGAAKAAYVEGADVVIVGRSRAKLDSAAQSIGSGVRTYQADASNEAEMQQLFARLDTVEHVFVTAAEVVPGLIMDTSSDAQKSTMDSRFWGSLFAAKYAAPKMKNGGSITFISGTAAHKPSAGAAVAAASAAAVESLARTLALELSPIRVNTICPGAVDTPLLDTFTGDQKAFVMDQLARTLPAKRMGQPEDIAEAALFLMKNKYTTGTVLYVDGGARLI